MLESTLHPEICSSCPLDALPHSQACTVPCHLQELFAIQASDSMALHVSYIFLRGLLNHGGSSVLDHLHNLPNSLIHAIFMDVLVKPVEFSQLTRSRFYVIDINQSTPHHLAFGWTTTGLAKVVFSPTSSRVCKVLSKGRGRKSIEPLQALRELYVGTLAV